LFAELRELIVMAAPRHDEEDLAEIIAEAINNAVVTAKAEGKFVIRLVKDVCLEDATKWRWLNGFLAQRKRSEDFLRIHEFEQQQRGIKREFTFKKERRKNNFVTASYFDVYTAEVKAASIVAQVCIYVLRKQSAQIACYDPFSYLLCFKPLLLFTLTQNLQEAPAGVALSSSSSSSSSSSITSTERFQFQDVGKLGPTQSREDMIEQPPELFAVNGQDRDVVAPHGSTPGALCHEYLTFCAG
jgi:hypothetical protein